MANLIIEQHSDGTYTGLSDEPDVTILVAKEGQPWETLELQYNPMLVEAILAQRQAEQDGASR